MALCRHTFTSYSCDRPHSTSLPLQQWMDNPRPAQGPRPTGLKGLRLKATSTSKTDSMSRTFQTVLKQEPLGESQAENHIEQTGKFLLNPLYFFLLFLWSDDPIKMFGGQKMIIYISNWTQSFLIRHSVAQRDRLGLRVQFNPLLFLKTSFFTLFFCIMY